MDLSPDGQELDNDERFEELLAEFEGLFLSKKDTMNACTGMVVKICSDSLTASNIRHPPITHRVKMWESARDSIVRKQKERAMRARLRAEVVSQGRNWEEYCHLSGLEPSKESAPFQSSAEMLSALHDYGGVRISLYFPGDVPRVAAILGEKFKVVRRTQKSQGANDGVCRLQERLSCVNTVPGTMPNVDGTTATVEDGHGGFVRTFNGYKATHFVVNLPGSEIPPEHDWKDVQIEIQIGTLVMHVWSEIHDMIYKPRELQGEKVTNDEERVLDLINGIVLTGEAALSQLEASTAKRLNQRAENESAFANSRYELATWIEKYCESQRVTLLDKEWCLLDRLYSILKATGDHQHFKVTSLLKEAAVEHEASRKNLLLAMLEALCKRSRHDEFPSINSLGVDKMVQNARFWALRLVHSLNLAIYLGVSHQFILLSWTSEPRTSEPRPSLVTFLDILHPTRPRYTSMEDVIRIASFCQSIFDKHKEEGLLKVALDLPRMNRVLGTADFDGYRRILVPGMINRIFSFDGHNAPKLRYPSLSVFSGITSISEELEWDVDAENEVYLILNIIESYQLPEGTKASDMTHVWELVRKQSGTELFYGPLPCTKQQGNGEHDEPIHYRFFASRPSSHDQTAELWQLVTRDIEMDIVELDLYKEISDIPSNLQQEQSRRRSSSEDEVLELAYRLHPQNQWGGVRDVYSVAKRRASHWLGKDSRPV